MAKSLTPGAFLRHGFELYRGNADPLWRIVFPLALAGQAVIVLLVLSSIPAGAQVVNGTIYVPAGSSLGAFNVARIVSDALFALIAVLSAGAATRLLATAALGQPESPGDAFRHASGRFLSVVWISILVGAAVAGGFLLLIVPGLYMIGALALAVPVVVVEDRRGFAALRRSRELVSGHWWPSFCAAFAAGLATLGLSLAVERGLMLNGSVTGFLLARAAALLIVEIFITPFSVATIVAIYVDLRARSEPETLPASFALGQAAPPAAPAGNPWL